MSFDDPNLKKEPVQFESNFLSWNSLSYIDVKPFTEWSEFIN